MASPNAKSLWRKARSSGIAARTNAPRKPAGKPIKLCIATGGDNFIMQITFETKPYPTLETEALVTYVFEADEPIQGRVADLDRAAGGLLKKIATSGELTGKMLEFTLLHAPAGLKAARLLLVGAGKREPWDSATLRKLAGAALRYLKSRSVRNFAMLVREGQATEESAQVIVEGILTADFESDKYKTDKKNDKRIASVSIAGYSD